MKFRILVILAFFSSFNLFAQKVTVVSPDKKINIGLFNTKNGESGEWYLKVSYINNGVTTEAIPQILLGLSRADQDFSKELRCLKNSKITLINENYTALHGKRTTCSNSANETVVAFENPDKARMNLYIRAYNDGIAFRYDFSGKFRFFCDER